MQLKCLMAVTAIALSATACTYAVKTSTDYDRTVNFGRYHTFFMLKGNSSGNPALDDRAADDVREVLMTKGWAEVPEGLGRAAIVVHAATQTRHAHETFYDGWGGWRWQLSGIGSEKTVVEDYKVGTVVVDIFDADTRQAIWHGVATDALPDGSNAHAKATEEAITKMFRKFPPGEVTR